MTDLELLERQVAFGICAGMPRKMIAAELGLTKKKICQVALRLFRRFAVDNRIDYAIMRNAALHEPPPASDFPRWNAAAEVWDYGVANR